MFYAHIVLAKKGPLARIWLAAHWDKKLTKAHVFETNIEQSVEGIMQPKVKLALRTSGHLLLGVVRIYSRKAKYLLADCNEAFVKIKMAFRPGMVDLPEEHREAAVNAITLPEVFHDFDTALPELNDVDIEAQFSINQTRADEITMREEYGSLPMSIHDDGFGDMGFDTDGPDFIRDAHDPTMDDNIIDMEHGEASTSKEPIAGTSRSVLDTLGIDGIPGDEEGFGEEFGQPAAGLFEGDLFGDAPIADPTLPGSADVSADAPIGGQSARDSDDDDDDMGHYDGGAPSPAPSSEGSRPPSSLAQAVGSTMPAATVPSVDTGNENDMNALNNQDADAGKAAGEVTEPEEDGAVNEEESFALAPVDATALKGVTKAKRKRKLIVDEVKNISGEEMKSQLANTTDIVTTLDLAPPTKRLMYWKETGGVEKLFALPSRDLLARSVFENYQRQLLSRSVGVEDFSDLAPAEVLALNQLQKDDEAVPTPTTPGKRGRKRKLPMVPDFLLDQAQEKASHLSPAPVVPPLPAVVPSIDHHTGIDESLPEPDVHRDASSNVMMNAAAEAQQMLEFDMLRQDSSVANINMPSMTQFDDPSSLAAGHDDMAMGDLSFHHDDDDGGGSVGDGGKSMRQADFDTIPNLPADQVSSILNGTGMENLGYASEHWQTNDDYDFPPSVGPAQPGEEQMEDETDEAFEERVLNKRAAQMFVAVRSRLQAKDELYLSEMTYRNVRKQAAQKFYSLLVLKKFQALNIHQSVPCGDILVTRGPMFDNPKL